MESISGVAERFAQISAATMLFIKFIKVQNFACSKFKLHMNILMLCNKIEINESEHFTQTITTKITESEHFMQTRMGIHIFTLLSERYIQKKTFRRLCNTDLHRIYKFHVILAGKKIKIINVNIVKIYMNNTK